MTKEIEEYIKKTATKHGVSFEEAMQYKITQEYIKYKEGNNDSYNYHRNDLLDTDNIKCC